MQLLFIMSFLPFGSLSLSLHLLLSLSHTSHLFSLTSHLCGPNLWFAFKFPQYLLCENKVNIVVPVYSAVAPSPNRIMFDYNRVNFSIRAYVYMCMLLFIPKSHPLLTFLHTFLMLLLHHIDGIHWSLLKKKPRKICTMLNIMCSLF